VGSPLHYSPLTDSKLVLLAAAQCLSQPFEECHVRRSAIHLLSSNSSSHDHISCPRHIMWDISRCRNADLRWALCAKQFYIRFRAAASSILVQSASSGERMNGLHTSSIMANKLFPVPNFSD
jgi:hypothetical protein